MNFFLQLVALVQNSNDEHNSENEDSDDEIEACAEKEEYVFPTPHELENTSKPAVGMVFSTLEEAVRFVNVYAQMNGFAMKKGRNYKQRKITIQCFKSSKTHTNNSGIRKRKRSVIERTNCPMNVTVKLREGKWFILSVCLEHNHSFVSSPSLTRFFLSYKHMNEAGILLSKLLQENRVKPR